MPFACAGSSTSPGDWQSRFEAIWHVDFEYRQDANHRPIPVCMFAYEQHTGATIELWRDQLLRLRRAPFDTGQRSLMVAYAANAELSCFEVLGWPFPYNVLDLYVEAIAAINGDDGVWSEDKRPSLLATLQLYGLSARAADEKKEMRDVILNHTDYSEQQRHDIQAYNRTDVEDTIALIKVMGPAIDLPRALLRGRYMGAVARMEHVGIPIDRDGLDRIVDNWDGVKRYYIRRDDEFGLFDEGAHFSHERFRELVSAQGWDWPLTQSGQLSTTKKVLGKQALRYPKFLQTAQLISTIISLRISSLTNTIGADEHSRCPLLPFWTKTGRNQPSARDKIFLPSLPSWIHGVIRPPRGYAVVDIDWSTQEVEIMAALSGDPEMIADFKSGDPYLGFAKRAGLVPENATKETHAEQRQLIFKPVVLGQNYGMTAHGIAARTGKTLLWARQIHARHRQVYPVYHRYLADAVTQAQLERSLCSPFGWPLAVTGNTKPRSLMNFPAQSGGADMLRIAAIAATEAGIQVAAPVHDAFWILAPLETIDNTLSQIGEIMQKASLAVTGGLHIDSEIAADVRWPKCLGDVREQKDKGYATWHEINRLITEGLVQRA